jgi:hypothetical protein
MKNSLLASMTYAIAENRTIGKNDLILSKEGAAASP